MKKYYCPYCGELTFSSYQKYTSNHCGVGESARKAMFFTCRNCLNEIERKSTPQGKKILNYIIPIYLILALAFLVFVVVEIYTLMFIMLAFIILFSFILTFVLGKTCILSRIDGNYNDTLFPIEIDSKEISVGGVYLLKPTGSELNKVSVCREYIAEITKDNLNQYFVRVIKPVDCTFEPLEFSIYDDKKCIGTGTLLV